MAGRHSLVQTFRDRTLRGPVADWRNFLCPLSRAVQEKGAERAAVGGTWAGVGTVSPPPYPRLKPGLVTKQPFVNFRHISTVRDSGCLFFEVLDWGTIGVQGPPIFV